MDKDREKAVGELARGLHETYEDKAKQYGWATQEQCRVPFDQLPEANVKTMLGVAHAIATDPSLQSLISKATGKVLVDREVVEWAFRTTARLDCNQLDCPGIPTTEHSLVGECDCPRTHLKTQLEEAGKNVIQDKSD